MLTTRSKTSKTQYKLSPLVLTTGVMADIALLGICFQDMSSMEFYNCLEPITA